MAPAGWYDNPENDTEIRLWDGSAWTSETKPKAAAPPPPPPPPAVPLAAQSYNAQTGFGQGAPAQPGFGGPQQGFGVPGNYDAPQSFTRTGPGPQGAQQAAWGSGSTWGSGPTGGQAR